MTRVMVCELDADSRGLEEGWAALVGHARTHAPDLVVLPELPFSPWLPATPEVRPEAWAEAITAHDRWFERLPELGAGTVVTSRPTVDGARRFNEGVVWVRDQGIVGGRRKTYLPDEPGFHEATWYDRGPTSFDAVPTPVATIGILLCTELWFPEHARSYGHTGAGVVAVPRATPVETLPRWEAAARVAAISAGAFVLSANRAGRTPTATFGGASWVVAPDGDVLARTSTGTPAVTVDVDLELTVAARTTYPRYVDARPVAPG